MKHNSSRKGTTLVEVIVGSVLLVSVVGLITLALAVVFEMYAASQQRGAIDQDGQYILARFKYVGSQQDSHVVFSAQSSGDFMREGHEVSNITASELDTGGIYLTDGQTSGEYTSPPIPLDYPSTVSRFVAMVQRPPGTNIRYRVAVGDAVAGSCADTQYEYVGSDGTESSYFETDYFSLGTQNDGIGYENPGECVRYKVFLTGNQGTTPILYSVTIQR